MSKTPIDGPATAMMPENQQTDSEYINILRTLITNRTELVKEQCPHDPFDCIENLEQIKQLLIMGAGKTVINASKPNELSPLAVAAQNDDTPLLKTLLQYGAETNLKSGRTDNKATALSIAAEYGHTTIARCLLQENADPNTLVGRGSGHTALSTAAQGGFVQLAASLLSNNANPDLEDDEDDAPLVMAIRGNQNDAQIVNLLLQHGATNGKDRALYLACQEGNFKSAQLLLAKNADANYSLEMNNLPTTPLLVAAIKGHKKIVQLLLDHQVKPDCRATLDTIVLAANSGIKELIFSYVNILSTNELKETLHMLKSSRKLMPNKEQTMSLLKNELIYRGALPHHRLTLLKAIVNEKSGEKTPIEPDNENYFYLSRWLELIGAKPSAIEFSLDEPSSLPPREINVSIAAICDALGRNSFAGFTNLTTENRTLIKQTKKAASKKGGGGSPAASPRIAAEPTPAFPSIIFFGNQAVKIKDLLENLHSIQDKVDGMSDRLFPHKGDNYKNKMKQICEENPFINDTLAAGINFEKLDKNQLSGILNQATHSLQSVQKKLHAALQKSTVTGVLDQFYETAIQGGKPKLANKIREQSTYISQRLEQGETTGSVATPFTVRFFAPSSTKEAGSIRLDGQRGGVSITLN